MPTKHSDVGAAAAAVAEVSSDGGKGGTKLRVEREEVVGRLSSNSKQEESARTQGSVRPGEARVVGVGSYISPHLMNQLTFRVTVGIEPEVSQGALGRGGGEAETWAALLWDFFSFCVPIASTMR